MPSLQAEVTGRFEGPADANHLLYTPLEQSLTVRQSRRYTVAYSGDREALTAFLSKVLADPVSHDLAISDEPVISGAAFILDYGMKGGALDLEKETILAHHRGDPQPGFHIESLRIARRLYVFDAAQSPDTVALADRFVRDIVNPAIHTWQVITPETVAA
jgi:hypothetical protein